MFSFDVGGFVVSITYMAHPHPRLSDGELEILRVIWSVGPCGIARVQAELQKLGRDLALTTVATRMKRMEGKKLIEATDDRRPRIYRANIEQDATAKSLVSNVMSRVFGGSASRMVLHLLKGERISAAERKAVQEQLDKMR